MVDKEKRPPRSNAFAIFILVLLLLASAAICTIVWVLPANTQQLIEISKIARAALPFVVGLAFLVLASIIGNGRRIRDYKDSIPNDSLFSEPEDEKQESNEQPKNRHGRKLRSLRAQAEEIRQALIEDEEKIEALNNLNPTNKTTNRIQKLEDDHFFLLKDLDKINAKIEKLTGQKVEDDFYGNDDIEDQELQSSSDSFIKTFEIPVAQEEIEEKPAQEPEAVEVQEENEVIDDTLADVTFEPATPVKTAQPGIITDKAVPAFSKAQGIQLNQEQIDELLNRDKLGFEVQDAVEPFIQEAEPAVEVTEPEVAEEAVEPEAVVEEAVIEPVVEEAVPETVVEEPVVEEPAPLSPQECFDQALEVECGYALNCCYEVTVLKVMGEAFALNSFKQQLSEIGDGFFITQNQLKIIVPFYNVEEVKELLQDCELEIEYQRAV